jgi:Gnt-I system low-affinity gluconate transporter
MMPHDLYLLLVAAVGLGLLLVLIIKFKLNPFVTLLLTSIFIGLCSGISPTAVIGAVQSGMANTLGTIAVIIGLGSIFGAMLEKSGGAEEIAYTLIKKFGEKNTAWALVITGFIVGVTVFFDVGFILLIPIIFGLAKKSKRSVLTYAIPLLGGLASGFAMVPPSPLPVAIAAIFHVNLGIVIIFGVIASIPTMILAGIVFGRFIGNKIYLPVNESLDLMDHKKNEGKHKRPTFSMTITIALVPLVLIVLNTLSNILGFTHSISTILSFIGNPFVALIIATLIAIYFLGVRLNYTREEIMDITTRALQPAGLIILIVGAGGVLKEMMVATGIGTVLGHVFMSTHMPIIVIAFLIALIARLTQGSSIVAAMTAAGLVYPIIEKLTLSSSYTALIIVAIGCGATACSHVNDSGFWLVNRYLGASIKDTFKSWTIMETIVGFTGFFIVLILSFFIA